MRVSILVPHRPEPGATGKQRRANWAWIQRRWQAHFPEAQIVVATDGRRTGAFSKSQAVNRAYAKSTGDMLVIADSDSWCDMPQLVAGLHYAAKLGVLVVPWTTAHRLAEADTAQIRDSDPSAPHPITPEIVSRADDYRPSPSTAAMILCITRESFERIGGFDPRFIGWGAEDVAFGLACDTLLGRKHIMPGVAYALHHDRPRDENGRRIWHADPGTHNVDLADRYWSARGNRPAMLALCAEHALPDRPVSIRPGAEDRPVDQLVAEFNTATRALVNEEPLVRAYIGTGFRDGDTVRVRL